MTNQPGPDFQAGPDPYQFQAPQQPQPYQQPYQQSPYQQSQQPPQPQAPYPQAGHHLGQPHARPAAAPRSGALGIVTLVLTALATGGGLMAAARSAESYGRLFLDYGMDLGYVPADDPLLMEAGGWVLLLLVCGVTWVVTLILSIVSIATGRGRGWGAIALVLTIVGAVTSVILFGAVFGNALQG